MWTSIPPHLAALSALFFLWLVLSFIWLWRLPPPTVSRNGYDSSSPWRRQIVDALAVAGVIGLGILLAGHELFTAWGAALILGAVIVLVRADTTVGAVGAPSAFIAVSLGIAALCLQLSAHNVFPPGLGEDEAKKASDCLDVLHGTFGLTSVRSLFHPNLPCLPMLPLLAWWGPSVLTVHAYPMLAATLSVVALYLIGRWMLPADVSLVSAALFATAPMLLLFGHMLQGAQITVLELLFFAFVIDAARRLSWISAVFAGVALGLLLYDYIATRGLVLFGALIFALAQIHARRGLWRRIAVGLLLAGVAIAVLLPLAFNRDGWTFLANPMQYRMADDKFTSFAWVLPALRDTLRPYHEGMAHHSALSHTQIGTLPITVAVIMLLGLGIAAAELRRFESTAVVLLAVSGLLPAFLSITPNVHRAILALPALYLFIGFGAASLAGSVGRRRGLVLAAIVVAGSVPSLLFYYGDAWSRVEDYSAFGGWSMQLVREVQRQANFQPTQVTDRPAELDFLAYDLLRSGRVRPFRYSDWLPENGSTEGISVVIEWNWAPLLWMFHDLVPAAEVRSLIGPAGGPRGGAILAHPSVLPRAADDGGPRRCGTLMFGEPRRITRALEGELEIEGIAASEAVKRGVWFGSGLHRACASDRATIYTIAPDKIERSLPVFGRDLYAIEPRGWVHRVTCANEPNRVLTLVTEPVLFQAATPWGRYGCTEVVHTWTTLVQPSDRLRLELRPVRQLISVTAAGEKLALKPRDSEAATIEVPAHSVPLRVEVKLQQQFPDRLDIAAYVRQGEALTLAPIALFVPPGDETVIAAENAAW